MSYIQTQPSTRGSLQPLISQTKFSGGKQFASDIAKISNFQAPGLQCKNQTMMGSYGLSLNSVNDFQNTNSFQVQPKNIFMQQRASQPIKEGSRQSATSFSNYRMSNLAQKNLQQQNRYLALPQVINQNMDFASRGASSRNSVDLALNLNGLANNSNGFMAHRNTRNSKTRNMGRNMGLYQSMKVDKLPISKETGRVGILVGQSVDLGNNQTQMSSRSPTKNYPTLETARRNQANDTAEPTPRIDAETVRSLRSPKSNFKSNRTRNRIDNQSVDAATAKKLFGTVTVQEMSLAGVKNALSEYGIKGYYVNPDLRFNFHNKDHSIPKPEFSKLNRYLDALMKQKAKIPSPDKYTGHKESFVDPKKLGKIYTSDRKWEFTEIYKKGKLCPGPDKYDNTRFDEKWDKPPKTCTRQKDRKFTYVDEIQFVQKQVPLIYDPIVLDKIKKRTYMCKLVPESDKEKEMKINRYKKDNSPSPVTYRKEEALEKSSAFNKTGVNFKMPKDKKITYQDKIVEKKKKIPGVGKYNPHLAIDKVSRPMKSGRY